jgi:hypothetical protein
MPVGMKRMATTVMAMQRMDIPIITHTDTNMDTLDMCTDLTASIN